MQEELIGRDTIRTQDEELIGNDGPIILPSVPGPAMGRPKKIDPSVIDDLSPRSIIDRLEEACGDITEFCKSFHASESVYVKMITRVYQVLRRPENESYLTEWNQLVISHRQAITALKERQALEMIQKMKMPDIEKTSMKDLMPMLNFWLPEYKDGAKNRVKKAAEGGDPTLGAVQEMLKAMEKNAVREEE